MGRKHVIVVVVDDEMDLRRLICDVLEEEGYTVTSLPNPQVALNLEERPSLFLLDLMLPGMSGIQLAERLRDGPFASVPIIAMSASSGMLRRASESSLFQATMPKPFDVETLLSRVENFALD